MNTKTCTKCGIEKEVTEFHKDRCQSSGLSYICKNCKKNYHLINKELKNKKIRIYEQQNKDKIRLRKKEYYLVNKLKILKRQEKYRNENKERVKLTQKNYRINYPEKRKQTQKKWNLKNSSYYNTYSKLRRKKDINFKIRCTLSSRLTFVTKNNKTTSYITKLLDCPIDFLRTHIESQFTEGMTWENYGTGHNGKGMQEWHIDHILPCASFDLSKLEEQQICFHWSNFQPLWATRNLSKGAKT
jgi:hypothetical protein